ncbi:hypothetical protein [Actinoallomurus sp. NPDC050550]|uniref:effector-associated constant component EACC1 n=1 Tax=Actinoallomurus sp. NPDC050550 TaxID=3154937 RepID=UPI0033C3B747
MPAAVSVFAGVLVAWTRRRTGKVTVTISRGGERELSLTADHVRGLTADQVAGLRSGRVRWSGRVAGRYWASCSAPRQ